MPNAGGIVRKTDWLEHEKRAVGPGRRPGTHKESKRWGRDGATVKLIATIKKINKRKGDGRTSPFLLDREAFSGPAVFARVLSRSLKEKASLRKSA